MPGGEIDVAWNATREAIRRIEVESSRGTVGRVVVPVLTNCSRLEGIFRVNGVVVEGIGTFGVIGAEPFVI